MDQTVLTSIGWGREGDEGVVDGRADGKYCVLTTAGGAGTLFLCLFPFLVFLSLLGRVVINPECAWRAYLCDGGISMGQ